MFYFNDFVIYKYKSFGYFYEGMATVCNQEGLWGYIDKTGKEVIPCQFEEAQNFSEGLAAVKVRGKWGYIDKTGKMVIEPQFSHAGEFSSGLAVAARIGSCYGYIDKTGTFVIVPFNSQLLEPFSEGFSVVKLSGDVWRIIDTNFGSAFTSHFKNLYSSKCGLFRFENDAGKTGYLNHNFNMQILPVFDKGSDFSEDMALIELAGGSVIGFTDKHGHMCTFLRGKPFQEIGDFHCGRSRVLIEGKYGFIDKEGNEVIPCQFNWAAPFNDGLAFVGGKDYVSYIDVDGNKVIDFPDFYCSKVQIGEETVVLEAKSKEELRLLKEAKLKELRSQVVSTFGVAIDSEGASVTEEKNSHVITPISGKQDS